MKAPVRDWVIDGGTHITEPPDLWTSRLAQRSQARAPRMVPECLLFENAARLYRVEAPDRPWNAP